MLTLALAATIPAVLDSDDLYSTPSPHLASVDFN